MACYRPLRAFKGSQGDGSKISIVFKRGDSPTGIAFDLPCGQCDGCRIERSRSWAIRCIHESRLYSNNCFITLTYNDEYLPFDGTLVGFHFQRFMKRLRKRFGEGIRFFMCGEYGEKHNRPHYHALLFNFDFPDKKFFKQKNGHNMYTSEILSELWPLGFHAIGDVTFESAAYVARYVMKKVTGEFADEHYQGRKPEYTTMSRKPGIGKNWFEKYKSDVYPCDEVMMNGKTYKPPRYYDKLLDIDNPELLKTIKVERIKNSVRFVDDVVDGEMIKVNDNDLDRLIVREQVEKARMRTLTRELEA